MKCISCGLTFNEDYLYYNKNKEMCWDCSKKEDAKEIIKCPKCQKYHSPNMDCKTAASQFKYVLRYSLVSNIEMKFLEVIKQYLPDGYLIQPQANLVSFIYKTWGGDIPEFFRNVDFIVTDLNYRPKFIIEINDPSHYSDNKIKWRDQKIKSICEEAGIPIVVFQTKKGINNWYIKKCIDETIHSLPVNREHRYSYEKNEPASETKNSISASDKEMKSDISNDMAEKEASETKKKEGCYIATYIYGSYDCPEVCVLRSFRDNVLYPKWYGRIIIKLYYFISPLLIKYFGKYNFVKKMWKVCLDHFISKLQIHGIKNAPFTDKSITEK